MQSKTGAVATPRLPRAFLVRSASPWPHRLEAHGRVDAQAEANDLVLGTTFLAMHPRVRRATFEAHVRLVLDTIERLLAVQQVAIARAAVKATRDPALRRAHRRPRCHDRGGLCSRSWIA
jgi:hypothetical protein